MSLVEDIIDIYLGYLYDRDLKTRIIIELVHTIWNAPSIASDGSTSAQAMLDPQTVADYVTH